MKKIVTMLLMLLAITTYAAFGHHAADDVVDEDVYAMIDELLEDTPHADMTLEELGAGMTEIVITTDTYSALMNLIDDGLLELVMYLDGQTTITYDRSQGEFTIVITSMGYNNSSFTDRERS